MNKSQINIFRFFNTLTKILSFKIEQLRQLQYNYYIVLKGNIAMELKEETLDSKIGYDGHLIKLRVDKIRLPNGRETTREVVVHRGAVAMVPVINDQVVLVRQYRYAAGEVLLEIPAGTLEVDEDPFDCARRELEEEIGKHPQKLTLLFSSYLAPGYSSEKLHMFVAQELVEKKSKADDDEFIEIVKVPISDVTDLILSGKIKDSKSISGILMAQKFLNGEIAI